MTFHPDSLPDLTGKVYIVTGGNSGIGYHSVARLAQHGVHVYMCARSLTKGSAAITGIKSLYPQAHISLLEMDLLSFSTVVSAAELFLSRETALYGLINNAGIMATPFERTEDGHEAQWQTNYLAHWDFTSHLLPLLLSTSTSLPTSHFSAPKGGINFADSSLPTGGGMARYGQSKLAHVLHAKTLNKLYGPGSASSKAGQGKIWTAAVHTGLADSQLSVWAEFPTVLRKIFALYSAVGGMMDADTGSWTSVFCAANPEMRKGQSEIYFQRIVDTGWQSRMAKNMVLSAKLEWTREEIKREGWVE